MMATFDFNKIENEKHCIDYFKSIRWKDGVCCPFCSNSSICHFSDGIRFKCKECQKIFSVKVGSIFENSRLSLLVWLKAIALLIKNPNITSVKLAESVGITQKSAWKMIEKLKNGNIEYLISAL
ncbi:MAG: transposase [Alphaproteobacteria bacterium]|nr:transposase [Rickettsiales bacterium]